MLGECWRVGVEWGSCLFYSTSATMSQTQLFCNLPNRQTLLSFLGFIYWGYLWIYWWINYLLITSWFIGYLWFDDLLIYCLLIGLLIILLNWLFIDIVLVNQWWLATFPETFPGNPFWGTLSGKSLPREPLTSPSIGNLPGTLSGNLSENPFQEPFQKSYSFNWNNCFNWLIQNSKCLLILFSAN